MFWFNFLNSPTKLLFIQLILSSVYGFYYSPIQELRSFASARLNRILNTTQRRSSSANFCIHPCRQGISSEFLKAFFFF